MLLAASATALSAGAADWKVNINPVALSPGDTVCIQNVGTGRYLTGGEAWGTQAVLGSISSAARCIIVDMGDGTYQINNNAAGWNETNPNMMYRQPLEGTVGAGVKACFVDYSTAWSRLWGLTPTRSKCPILRNTKSRRRRHPRILCWGM